MILICVLQIYLTAFFAFSRSRYGIRIILDCCVNIFLLFLYYFGPFIWNSIRRDVGDGYLGFLPSTPDNSELFRSVLSPIIVGIMSAILFYFIWSLSKPLNVSINSKLTKASISLWDKLLIYLPIAIYLIGQGSSVFNRGVYLQTNGIDFIARLGGVTNLISFGAILYVIYTRNDWKKIDIYFPLTFWYILLVSSGSRSTLIVIAIAILLINKINRNWFIKIPIISFFLLLFYYSYQVILISRSNPIGILNLPTNFQSTIFSFSEFHGPETNFLFSLLGGLFIIIILIPLSVGSANFHQVLLNANPLISSIASQAYTYSSNGVERIFPYSWVPTSTAGTLFGVIGFFGIFVIFFILTLLHTATFGKRTQEPKATFFVMSDILFFGQFVFFLEYSSRIWFRMFWALLISLFAGFISNSGKKQIKEGVGE